MTDKRNSRKGKTYEEIYGFEKAKLWKEKQKLAQLGEKNHFFNKHHTKKSKKKIGKESLGRKTMLNKHLSPEAKNKIRISCLERKKRQGYLVSPKARKKIGKISKELWQNSEYLKKMEKRNEKLSKILSGKNCHFYKDGKSQEPYNLKFNERNKKNIRKRDKKCKICNLTKEECLKIFKKEFCVHHIIRNKKVYNPFHLISLCPHCHTKILKFQNDLKDYFYAKNLLLI